MASNSTSRLLALDALRGFTIMAMIIVNDPGSWSHVYAPLLHAPWNGATPTDYVFPFFLFIVGVSITMAYHGRLASGAPRQELVKKVVLRSLKIYGVGLFLWLWPDFDFSTIRWAGVLQRISVVFLACALLFLYTNWKFWIRLGIGLLVGYWILIAYVPVPGIGTPDLSVPIKNWAHYFDSQFLPGKLWQETWDPEGILSTFPAIVTGILGMLAGKLILEVEDTYRKLTWLFFGGFSLYVVAGAWDWFFPINKNLWTSSYVLHTGGLATLSLAASILITDVLGMTKWTAPGRIFGANAITAYVLASMLTVVFYNDFGGTAGLNTLWMNGLQALGFSLEFGSFTYALLYVAVIFIPVYLLYKRKIFIKL
jgi:predicted acyltransferase